MAQYTTMSKESIQYLCGLINQIATLPTSVIDNINLADNLTFSNIHIKDLVERCLIDAKDYADLICSSLIKLTCEKTTVQPTLDNSEINVIYLYSADGNAPFQQYLKINDTELIDMGSTTISLTDYLTATQIAATYAKQIDLKTLTDEVKAIKDEIGTETLDTTATTIKGAINEVAGKSQIITLTKSEYESLATKDPETYYIISDDEDSVSISTTISSTSTNSEIPTSKAVNDKFADIKGNCNIIYPPSEFTTLASYIESLSPDRTYFVRCTLDDAPTIEGVKQECVYIIVKHANEYTHVLAHDCLNSTTWERAYVNSSWVESSWKKVCVTSVTDVPRTIITFTDTTYYSPLNTGNECWYEVKNGICYVNLRVTCVTPNTDSSNIIFNNIPKCNGTLDAVLHPITSLTYAKPIQANVFGNVTNLLLRHGEAGATYFGSFSYPVKES